jgi:hypothetical protein
MEEPNWKKTLCLGAVISFFAIANPGFSADRLQRSAPGRRQPVHNPFHLNPNLGCPQNMIGNIGSGVGG